MKKIILFIIFLSVYITGIFGQRFLFDFEMYPSGTVLMDQDTLAKYGISFPNGIEISDCSVNTSCNVPGYSGDKIGWGVYDFEFSREPLIIRFETPQDSVSFYARPAFSSALSVFITGFLSGEEVYDSTSIFENTDDAYRFFRVTNVDSIVINAGSPLPGYVAIDNLQFGNFENTGISWDSKGNIEYSVYPVPFHEKLHLKYYLDKYAKVTIRIYDLTGKIRKEVENGYRFAGSYHYQINTADLYPGMFILEISIGENRDIKRILKTGG